MHRRRAPPSEAHQMAGHQQDAAAAGRVPIINTTSFDFVRASPGGLNVGRERWSALLGARGERPDFAQLSLALRR